jgi:RsiW-degrading membrane proteinase PrsW (M82 family)
MLFTFITVVAFIILAVGLTWYFVSHDRGEKKPIGALWIAAGFGVLAAIAAGFLEAFLIPSKYSQPGVALGLPLILSSLGIGIIEESCKFLPLSFFLYGKRYFNEHTDGVIYFAIAGLGFGVPENILYTFSFGAKVGVVRIVLTPFFHAATTGMVGYYLAKNKLSHRSKWATAVPLLIAIVLHGTYDLGLLSGNGFLVVLSLMITAGVTLCLFLFYMRAGEHDQAEGLSAVGHNSFCRSCGSPNPKHNLYCTRCGKRA